MKAQLPISHPVRVSHRSWAIAVKLGHKPSSPDPAHFYPHKTVLFHFFYHINHHGSRTFFLLPFVAKQTPSKLQMATGKSPSGSASPSPSPSPSQLSGLELLPSPSPSGESIPAGIRGSPSPFQLTQPRRIQPYKSAGEEQINTMKFQ